MSNQIEIRHLRYFTALATHLNFHRAAHALSISQPGLSRQIAQLEFHLGTPLFIRNRKNVTLTASGIYLYEQIIPQLNKLDQVYAQTRDIGNGRAGEIRIGFLGSAMQQVIPEMLLGLKQSHPELQAALVERSNKDQIAALLAVKQDLGFVRLTDLPSELEGCTVVRETFSLVVPKDHPITPVTFNTMSQLKEENFILFSPEYSPEYYRTVLSICEEAGFHPRISHRSVHAHTIFRLVEAGFGVAIIPTSLQKGFQMNIRCVELSGIRQRAVLSAVWKREHHNRALDSCIAQLKSHSILS